MLLYYCCCTRCLQKATIAKRRRIEECKGARSTPLGTGGPGRHQAQDKSPSFNGVKAENDAFRAFVLYKNQTTDIGLFATAQEAARAYDRKVWGGRGGAVWVDHGGGRGSGSRACGRKIGG